MLSDPVELDVPPLSDLAVRLYLPERTEGTTTHAFAFQRTTIANGNATGAQQLTPASTAEQWFFLTGVSVRTRPPAASIVALGDSITDGASSTVGANRRWPDLLARRLHAAPGPAHLGVLNAGVCGNRLLHDPNPPLGSEAEEFAMFFGPGALRRFDRDVGAQPGARYVIVQLGVNDLGHPGLLAPAGEEVPAAAIIGAHRQLIARAHDRGMKIFGCTITPFGGNTLGMYSAAREAARQAVNTWIRTSGEYDALIDFDAALRDPARPVRLLPGYDSGDHLHPNDAGMDALAHAVPLDLFR
jgi:lysophospholipase L1-like esterase